MGNRRVRCVSGCRIGGNGRVHTQQDVQAPDGRPVPRSWNDIRNARIAGEIYRIAPGPFRRLGRFCLQGFHHFVLFVTSQIGAGMSVALVARDQFFEDGKMADEMRDDSQEQREERPKRITLSGRRHGRLSFEVEQPEEPAEDSALYAPARRTTGERRRAS